MPRILKPSPPKPVDAQRPGSPGGGGGAPKKQRVAAPPSSVASSASVWRPSSAPPSVPNTGASIASAPSAPRPAGARPAGARPPSAMSFRAPSAPPSAASFATAPSASRPAAGLPEITPVDENADVFVFDGVDQVRTWLDPGAPRPLAAPKSKTAKAKPGRRLADSMPSISKQKKKGFKKGSRSEPVMLGTPRKRADLTVEEAMLGTTEERTERAIDEADAKARAIRPRNSLARNSPARNFLPRNSGAIL